MSQPVLRIKGHALEHSRSGCQSLLAVGRCKCGEWRKVTTSREAVVIAYRSHLDSVSRAVTKDTGEEVVTLPSGRQFTAVYGRPAHRERAEARANQSFGLERDRRKG